jgi:cytochrome b
MAAMQNLIRVRVWDLPTRLFHWALVFCFAGLGITGTVGGEAMTFHFRFGYSTMTLLMFRLAWGVVGGRWSRFSSFLFAPRAVFAYLKVPRAPGLDVGHSPLAALSVWALLTLLSAQVASGLVSDDEITFSGPLSHLVSNSTASLATFYHADIGKWILLALVMLHLVAIVYHTHRQHRLVIAMIHGDKQLPVTVPPSRDDAPSRWLAFFIFALCSAFTYWVANLQPPTF